MSNKVLSKFLPFRRQYVKILYSGACHKLQSSAFALRAGYLRLQTHTHTHTHTHTGC